MDEPVSRWDLACRLVAEQLRAAAREQGWEALVPEIAVEVPSEPGHGDLTSNVALKGARLIKRAPQAIAQALAARPERFGPVVERIEVAGPGFLNFTLATPWLAAVVEEVNRRGAAYGDSRAGAGRRVLLEFVSANPTGPLVVVNGRAAAIGDSLARMLAAAGYRVEREYYVNDAGNQVRALGQAMLLRLRQLAGRPLPEPWPEGVYPGDYVIPLAQAFWAEHPGWDVDVTPDEATVDTLGRYAAEHLRAGHEAELARFRVHFDRWFSERGLRERGEPDRIVERLDRLGLLESREGALWFCSTRFGDDKDRVVRKADGSFTYFVPDAAYHVNKFERGFDAVIDLLGPDHHGYIGRIRAVLRALGYPADRLEVLIVQMVRLLRGGQPVKMSKRGGEFVTLGELVEEAGVDAARYFFVERAAETPLDFDLDLAQVRSLDNPVYYIQYAAARIHGILRQAPAAGERPVDLGQLKEPLERALLVDLARFPDVVARAAQERAPQWMPRYLTELASDFHAFYKQHRILGAPPELEAARLALIQAVLTVVRRGLDLIGVNAPERM